MSGSPTELKKAQTESQMAGVGISGCISKKLKAHNLFAKLLKELPTCVIFFFRYSERVKFFL